MHFNIPKRIDRKEVICAFCGELFSMERWSARKYCSNVCRDNSIRKRHYGLCTGTFGAVNELRVCIDLMLKGYEVFRSISPAASCDLAILKNDKLIRIEVKTAIVNQKREILNSIQKHRADVLALVGPNWIVYRPELPT